MYYSVTGQKSVCVWGGGYPGGCISKMWRITEHRSVCWSYQPYALCTSQFQVVTLPQKKYETCLILHGHQTLKKAE